MSHSGRMGGFLTPLDKKADENQLGRITCDSSKMAVEQVKGLASQVRTAGARWGGIRSEMGEGLCVC